MAKTSRSVQTFPTRDCILVRRHEHASMSAGGIALPETMNNDTVEGVAVAVGSGHLTDDGCISQLEVQEGDTVIFQEGAGIPVEVDDQKYLILREIDILLIRR